MIQDFLPFDAASVFPAETPADKRDVQQFRLLQAEGDLAFPKSILDAYRIKICHVYDKLNSLSNSRTRLLPHQIEATHRIVNSLRPRFIIADEVGLGKTIEAGLVIKELMFRKGYNRILVVTPATLTVQWQQEMKSKFNEDFVCLTRKNFEQISSAWKHYPRIITSIDFVKHPRYTEAMLKGNWEIAVFDEAHRLRRDYSKVTHAYHFAEKIAARTEACFLLSATPFRGKLEELYYLVQLVDPDLLGPHSAFIQEYVLPSRDNQISDKAMSDLQEKIRRIMIRRRKVEVGGFTKRHARTVRFDLSPEERQFYDETTEYVKREYNLAMMDKNRAVGFVMIVFQKLLDSSTRALLKALEKRRVMLEGRLHGTFSQPVQEAFPEDQSGNISYIHDIEELEDTESPEEILEWFDAENRISLKELRKEVLMLNHLIRLGRSIKTDRKVIKLKETIEKLKKEGHVKFIIFTQFRSTQDYLAECLADYRVTCFHGSLNVKEKEQAIEEFKAYTEILICTEAGGEGRNLQFASILFNYDLPWSPLKIEQRIGRIHRFGQSRDVYIFNFSTRNTVAERVLEILETKIRLFEQSIGPSDALLGAIEDELDFASSLMHFVAGRKTKEELDSELDAKLRLSEIGYQKLNELITPHRIDFNLDDYYNFTSKTRAIDNAETEQLALSYLAENPSESFSLQRCVDDAEASPGEYILTDRASGKACPATFRSDVALERSSVEFLAVGHPLVDRALAYFLHHPAKQTLQFAQRSEVFPAGFYFVYLCRYHNGLSRAELLSCYVPDDSSALPVIVDELPSALLPPDEEAALSAFENLVAAEERAHAMLIGESEKRGLALKEKLEGIFKKEEYKLAISYEKRIRHLEEKRDRQRLQVRLTPLGESRSTLTRTENEIVKAKHEMQLVMDKIHRESQVKTSLELLQIYRII